MNAEARHGRPALRWLAAGAGFATALYATHAGFTWLRYGHPPVPARDEIDPLLDRLIPVYEVVDRHSLRVAAPAETTLASACDMDLTQSAIIRSIFKARELLLGSHPDTVRRPQTLLAWARELGWAVLAESPDREIVFGAVTSPWVANPVFRPLPPHRVCQISRARLRQDRMDITCRSDQCHGFSAPHRNPRRHHRPGFTGSLPALLGAGLPWCRVDSPDIAPAGKKRS